MDIALFDTFAGRRHTLARAGRDGRDRDARHVVLYTWDAAPAFVDAAREIGVSGVVLKTRSADALVEALERVAAGERVGLDDDGGGHGLPARAVELSDRESEVLALDRAGPDERRDRPGALPLGRDGQDVRQAAVRQARGPQSGPSRGGRLQPAADAALTRAFIVEARLRGRQTARGGPAP